MSTKYKYTGNASFEDAYHDCKLVDDSIVDAESFQSSDSGLVLCYMDRILEALEKQIPKAVKYNNRHGDGYDYYNRDHFNCPTCGRRLRNKQKDPYCGRCGQKLNWDV